MNLVALRNRPEPLRVGRIRLRDDQNVARWAAGKTGLVFLPPYIAMGIEGANGQLIGAAIYNSYVEADVELSIYAPHALTRGVIKAIAEYPFNQLGCRRMTTRTRASSLATRKVIERVGFQREGVLRQYYPDGDDAIIYGMLADSNRWWTKDARTSFKRTNGS
jgi:RimJ/RimL family protein N-acetyltransferase